MSNDNDGERSSRDVAKITPEPMAASATVGSVRTGIRSYFSTAWLRAGIKFSDEARVIEAQHRGGPNSDPIHRAFVIASIQAAVAFMEANVNELYQDAADGHGTEGDGYVAPLPEATRWSMSEVWQGTGDGRKLEALSKYQLMLTTAGLPTLDRGVHPYQDAAAVTRLRNVLVHYQPETIFADESNRLESQLKDKFSDNKMLAGSGNAWWPSRCLGAGCCDWAISSVRSLADHVANNLGITPNYKRQGL